MSPTTVIVYLALMNMIVMSTDAQPIDPCYTLLQKFKQSYTEKNVKLDYNANERVQDFSTKPPIEKHVRKRDMDSLDNENTKNNTFIWPDLIACGRQPNFKNKLTMYGAPDRLIAIMDHHIPEGTT